MPEVNVGAEPRVIDLGGVNCFLFAAGDGFVLVDTGFAFQRPLLERRLEEAGCGQGDLKLIVLTHGDGDHVGSCAYLKRKHGAEIAMHREDAASAGSDPGKDRVVKFGLMNFLEVFMGIGMALRAVRTGSVKPEPFEVDFFLEDGHSLVGRGVDARVLHIPGHSRGSVGLLLPSGDLIAGDLFMNLVAPNFSAIRLPGGETAASVAKLDGLGLRDVLPSHGRPFPWKRYARRLARRASGHRA
jgi:hydroxyacylglutathione hydrolase